MMKALRTQRVRVDRLVFDDHDMSWDHVDRWQAVPTRDRPPLLVQELVDGHFFIHDGRHRATAAYEDGQVTISAVLVGP